MTHIYLTDYNYNWFLLESESLSRRNNQTWRRRSTASNIPPLNLEHTFFRYKHVFANIHKTQELSTPWSRHCLDAAQLLVSRSQDISASQLRTSVRLTHTLMSRAPGMFDNTHNPLRWWLLTQHTTYNIQHKENRRDKTFALCPLNLEYIGLFQWNDLFILDATLDTWCLLKKCLCGSLTAWSPLKQWLN